MCVNTFLSKIPQDGVIGCVMMGNLAQRTKPV